VKIIDAAGGPDTQDELITGKTRTRDDTQKHVDRKVEAMKVAWVEAGKPSMPHKITHRYLVSKPEKSALKGVIRRAGTLHKVGVAFYKDTKPDADGNVFVKFTVTDFPAKPQANGAPAAGVPAAPAASAPVVSAPAEQPKTDDRSGRFGRR
jgi:hypothetical protein